MTADRRQIKIRLRRVGLLSAAARLVPGLCRLHPRLAGLALRLALRLVRAEVLVGGRWRRLPVDFVATPEIRQLLARLETPSENA